MKRAVAGAPTFVSCCDVLLDEKGNGWMLRAKRVAEETSAHRRMVVTSAASFVKVVNMFFADYMHRVYAPEQLGLTAEAAAALRTLKRSARAGDYRGCDHAHRLASPS